jgi:hypothetical protein
MDKLYDPSYDIKKQIKWFEEAKQMEEEQIKDAYIMGSYDMASKEFNPEQYYNETFQQ